VRQQGTFGGISKKQDYLPRIKSRTGTGRTKFDCERHQNEKIRENIGMSTPNFEKWFEKSKSAYEEGMYQLYISTMVKAFGINRNKSRFLPGLRAMQANGTKENKKLKLPKEAICSYNLPSYDSQARLSWAISPVALATPIFFPPCLISDWRAKKSPLRL
jgi:hypothetical protein